MKKRAGWRQFFLLAAVAGLCVSAEAGLSELLAGRSAKNRVDSLIITGNYAKSRLLAELVQYRTKQPVLLVSPTREGGMKLYFLPSGLEAMELDGVKYEEFVDFLQPKRIVFLGDEDYLPASYVDALRDQHSTVIVNGKNWQKNADMTARLFRCRLLARDYVLYLRKLNEASATRPAGLDAAPAPGMPAEPAAFPRSIVPAEPTE